MIFCDSPDCTTEESDTRLSRSEMIAASLIVRLPFERNLFKLFSKILWNDLSILTFFGDPKSEFKNEKINYHPFDFIIAFV